MKTDSSIASFIENFPNSASLKEADTGRYLINNLHNSLQFGIKNPPDLIGLTINDIRFRNQDWGKRYATSIERLDFHARTQKTHASHIHHFLDDGGDAQLEEMIKFPILGHRKNVLAIATYRNDITKTLSPSALYHLYRRFYNASNAISRVMSRIGVDRHFFLQPTDTQFRILSKWQNQIRALLVRSSYPIRPRAKRWN